MNTCDNYRETTAECGVTGEPSCFTDHGNQYTCLRCGHVWTPRKKGLPVRCPRCTSPYWNKPRQDAKRKGSK